MPREEKRVVISGWSDSQWDLSVDRAAASGVIAASFGERAEESIRTRLDWVAGSICEDRTTTITTTAATTTERAEGELCRATALEGSSTKIKLLV